MAHDGAKNNWNLLQMVFVVITWRYLEAAVANNLLGEVKNVGVK